MITVPEELKALINADSRTFRVRLLKNEEVYEEILSLKKSVAFPFSSMSIGNALSACVECTASDIPVSITGVKMQVEISAYEWEEWIKLGTFTAEKPTVQDGNVTFTAYDAMASAANVSYKSTLDDSEHTAQEYFDDICAVLGEGCVELDENLASLVISVNRLSGYSCRDALAYLAGYLGRNCVVNRDGLFEMVPFKAVNYDMLNADRIAVPELSDSDCVIGYLACCVDDETTLQSGNGSRGFEFVCPFMTQERLDEIGTELFGEVSAVRVYRPGKIKQLLGDPRLEISDVVSLNFNGEIYVMPIMSLVLDFDGGLQTEIESFELAEPNALSLSERISFEQKQAKAKTDAYINSVAEFSQAIQKAYGVLNTNIDGITYFHDTEKIEDAKYIYCMTTNGIAFTNSWGGSHDNTVWKYGIDKDGEAFLNMLNVFHIKADLIEAGKITSKDGKTYYDLDNGVIGTTDTEKDENGEDVVRYQYEQSAEGVFLKTGTALTFQEYLDSLSDERKAEIEAEILKKLGIEDPSEMSSTSRIYYKLYSFFYKTNLWRLANKGFTVQCEDDTGIYQYQFSGNKAIFSKMTNGESAETQYSADGIKSDQRLKIEAPGIDLPVTILTSEDDCNQIFDDGVYIYSTDTVKNGLKNAPFPNAAVILIFGAKSVTTQKIQIAFRYGATGYFAFRPLFNGWLSWSYRGEESIQSSEYPGCFYRIVDGETEWVNPPMEDGVEYRTTERIDGKPVYKQYGSLGALPNATTKAFAVSVSGAKLDKAKLTVEAYNSSNRRYTFPFINTDGAIRAIVYATGARTYTIKSFSDLSDYSASYFIEFTKQ